MSAPLMSLGALPQAYILSIDGVSFNLELEHFDFDWHCASMERCVYFCFKDNGDQQPAGFISGSDLRRLFNYIRLLVLALP